MMTELVLKEVKQEVKRSSLYSGEFFVHGERGRAVTGDVVAIVT